MSISRKEIPDLHPSTSHVIAPVLRAVRTNCHITDARHAADYTLCVYLLKMREYYRWEYNIPFSATLPHKEVTGWLTVREALWKTLEENPFEAIPVASRHYDPFDAEAINRHLTGIGYVYSSGIGRNRKPHFFLGDLDEHSDYDGYTLYISGKEYARDLTAPPAMCLGRTIFVRRESLRRMLWEKIEEWRWNQPANAMQKAIRCYDFENLPETALNQMTDNEIRSVILHEIGEVMAGAELGSTWEDLLAAIAHSKTELLLRAVRDHLADALSTLPRLLDELHPASLHFYIANLSNLQKSIFPSLISAYEDWDRSNNPAALIRVSRNSKDHWRALAQDILELHGKPSSDCWNAINKLVESRTL